MPEDPCETRPALRNHQDLFNIIHLLKEKRDATRDSLTQEHFDSYGEALPDKLDQERAFDLAVRIMATVKCTQRRVLLGTWSRNIAPRVWRGNETTRKFFLQTFPMSDVVDLGDEEGILARAQLAAHRLKRIHGFDFKGTDDLDRHLVLDPRCKKRTVLIYHHTAFLKEHIMASQDETSVSGYGSA